MDDSEAGELPPTAADLQDLNLTEAPPADAALAPTVIEPAPGDMIAATVVEPTSVGGATHVTLSPERIRSAIPDDLDPKDRSAIEANLEDPTKWIASYVVLRELGKGGMGVVLKAYDPKLRRLVAIKQVLGEMGESEWVRFEREARLAGKLRHPGIARVHEIVTEQSGSPYLVLEYVPGSPLHHLTRGDTPLQGRRAAEILRGVAEAIAHAHEHNVIHRDLKPHNVIVTPDGRPIVLDFGLAKELESASRGLTQEGQVLGTLAYMAPEQADGRVEGTGTLADVYGLGAILYECITGQPPFTAKNRLALISAVLDKDPQPPHKVNPRVHRDLETVCLKCLEKNPANRYPGAAELAEELQRFLDGEPIEARPVLGVTRVLRRLKRNKALGAALALAVVLAVGIPTGWWLVSSQQRETEEQREALREQEELTRSTERELDSTRELSATQQAALREGVEALTELSEVMQFRYRPLQRPEDEALLLKNARADQQSALKKLQRARAKAPELAELQVIWGEAHLQLQDVDEALASADRALGIDDESGAAWLLKAQALLTWSNLGEFGGWIPVEELRQAIRNAAKAFARARELGLRLDPVVDVWSLIVAGGAPYPKAHARAEELRKEKLDERVEYVRAWLAWQRQDVPTALTHLDAALRLCPRMLEALKLRGYLQYGRQPQEAVAMFTRVLALKPEDRFALWCRVRLAGRMGDTKTMEADCTVLLKHWPDAETWTLRGDARLASRNPKGAQADYLEALRLDPDHATASTQLGFLLFQQNELEPALARLSHVVAKHPRDAGAWHTRGLVHTAMGKSAEALTDFTQALTHSPGYWRPYYRRAELRIAQKEFTRAITDLDRAVELTRQDPLRYEVLRLRGYARLGADDRPGALDDFRASLRLQPNQPHTEDMRRHLAGGN